MFYRLHRLVPAVSLVLCIVFLHDAPAQEPDKKKSLPKTEKLEPCECGKIERIHTLDGIFLASQPAPDDFKIAKEAGIKSVINLREKGEQDWDERALAKELGLDYHHVPFRSPESLTDEVFERTRKVLNDGKNKPILMHCASANRVGAIWLAHRVIDHEIAFDKALDEAKKVGLKSPEYTDRVKDYIARSQKSGQSKPQKKDRN